MPAEIEEIFREAISDEERRGKFRGLARAIEVLAEHNANLLMAGGEGSPMLVEIAQKLFVEAEAIRPR